MPRVLQVFALLVIALAVPSANAFSLLGPLGGAPGGETWQTPDVGSDLAGDIGAVKNLTEEYRWNVPVITYGFDPSFINYFGTNGVNAIESAIAVYNSLPDLSTISQELFEYPLEDPNTGASTTFRDSRRVNFTAQALNLLDLKTYTMGALIENLGLASPERYVWTLRARVTVGPLPITNYFTIMRNFDPVTYMPSRYVNGSRYTYNILEVDGPRANYAFESPADPESALYSYSSVANIMDGDLSVFTGGEFYSYLTRDDIGGLRYIYDRVNLNWESFAPGTQITAPDFSSINFITNIDLLTFSAFTFQNPPAAVLAQFPDLVFRTPPVPYVTSVVEVVGTSLTNSREPWDDPFTTNLVFTPILATNPVVRYIYSFANVITNYASAPSIIRSQLVGFQREPWSTPDFPVFRTNITLETVDFPSGGILIVPTNVGTYTFIEGLSFPLPVTITNVIFETNLVDNGFPRLVQVSEIFNVTNTIYAINPTAIQPAPQSVLRGGVGELTFERLGNALFSGTNFVHTNSYTVVYYTNTFGVVSLLTNTFSIVKDLPDFLFGAADLGTIQEVPVLIRRTSAFVSNAGLNSSIANQGGPGNIFGPINVTFSKVGPGLFNSRPGIATEAAALQGFGESFIWGSFDGSTNPPVVYPKDITLEDVEMLITGGLAP